MSGWAGPSEEERSPATSRHADCKDAQGLDCMAGPDLVLLGLMMPVVDGFEFVERPQADDRFRDVPVVVLTAKKLSGEEKAFLHSRTQSVIQKGSEDREALLRLARRLLAVSPARARLISP